MMPNRIAQYSSIIPNWHISTYWSTAFDVRKMNIYFTITSKVYQHRSRSSKCVIPLDEYFFSCVSTPPPTRQSKRTLINQRKAKKKYNALLNLFAYYINITVCFLTITIIVTSYCCIFVPVLLLTSSSTSQNDDAQ